MSCESEIIYPRRHFFIFCIILISDKVTGTITFVSCFVGLDMFKALFSQMSE